MALADKAGGVEATGKTSKLNSKAMRNGMLASLGVFLVAALVLKIPFGNFGLWLSLHLWFVARGGFYWWFLERRRASLFA